MSDPTRVLRKPNSAAPLANVTPPSRLAPPHARRANQPASGRNAPSLAPPIRDFGDEAVGDGTQRADEQTSVPEGFGHDFAKVGVFSANAQPHLNGNPTSFSPALRQVQRDGPDGGVTPDATVPATQGDGSSTAANPPAAGASGSFDIRTWPNVLARSGQPGTATNDQVNAIIDAVAHNRAQVNENLKMHLHDKAKGDGMQYTRDGTQDATPTNMQSADPRRTQVNQLIWRELGKTEGSSGAINSYDGKNHVTFGRGFLATTGKNGGLMGEVLTKLFATDPAAQNMLLDAGFTIQNGTWLAVNITTGSALLEGSAALGMVQFDTSVLSLLTQLAEGPDHGQNVANAEWDVASKNAAAVPADCLSWPDSSILFGFHTITWHGAINWSMVKGTGGDIARMIRLTTSQNFGDVGSTDKDSGAYMVNGQSTQTFLGFANGAARAVLQSAGPLPDDIASTPNAYAGHIFFAAGGDQYYHLAP